MVEAEIKDFVSGLVTIVEKKISDVAQRSHRLAANTEVGEWRVRWLRREAVGSGFFVVMNSAVNAGVDLETYDRATGRLVEVIESTNDAESSRIPEVDLRRYIKNLGSYNALPNVAKILAVSFKSNLHLESRPWARALIQKNQITIREFGYQQNYVPKEEGG